MKYPGSNTCRYRDETLREIRGGTPGLILPVGIQGKLRHPTSGKLHQRLLWSLQFNFF